MALVPCRECGKEISSDANNCPHCGVSKPSKGQVKKESAFTKDLLGDASPTKRKYIKYGAIALVVASFAQMAMNPPDRSAVPDRTSGPSDIQELCKDLIFYTKKVRDAKSMDEQLSAEKDLAQVKAWLAQYQPEEVSRVCLKKDIFAVAAPPATKDAPQPSPAASPLPSAGDCTSSPLEIFETGKLYDEKEFGDKLSSACPGNVVGADKTVTVKRAGQTYLIEFVQRSGTNGVKLYEITGIRGK